MTCDEHDWSLAHGQLAGSDKGGYLAALITYYAFVSPLTEPQHLSGGTIAIIVGVAGAVYGGLGVGQAVQNAMDTVWAVPRHKRQDPIRSRVRSRCCFCSARHAAGQGV